VFIVWPTTQARGAFARGTASALRRFSADCSADRAGWARSGQLIEHEFFATDLVMSTAHYGTYR
jgi:hypothetical protein